MSIAALVLGILGTVFSLFPGLFIVGIPLSLVALVLGVLGRKDAMSSSKPTSTATAGVVLGCIGTVVGLSMFALCGSLFKMGKDMIVKEQAAEQATRREPDLKLKVEQMTSDYDRDPAAAEKKYRGKAIEATGEVLQAIATGPVLNLVVGRRDIKGPPCLCVLSSQQPAGTLTEDQSITVRGVVDRFDQGQIRLRGCRLLQ